MTRKSERYIFTIVYRSECQINCILKLLEINNIFTFSNIVQLFLVKPSIQIGKSNKNLADISSYFP